MSKPIRTYEELMAEKARLKLLLEAQKDLVREDINLIKQEITPLRKAMSIAGKFTTRENRYSLLTMAADTVIDMFVKRVVLSKAGFVTKLVVPFLVKNFSSHLIADNREKIISKLAALFGGDQAAKSEPHHNGSPYAESAENKGTNAEEEED